MVGVLEHHHERLFEREQVQEDLAVVDMQVEGWRDEEGEVVVVVVVVAEQLARVGRSFEPHSDVESNIPYTYESKANTVDRE